MSVHALKTANSLRSKVSPEEWQARVDTAACYRLMDVYGMTDLIANHISMRVPGEPHAFLINAYGLLYEEITASSLLKIDHEGNILAKPEFPDGLDYGVNRAGFVIHSAIHMAHQARHRCVMHTHTRAGMAVAATKEGLLPISMNATAFHGALAYHDYEGVSLEVDERPRLVADLGDKTAMMLKNHGLLTTGRSVPEAFLRLYRLERACQTQVDAGAAGTISVMGSNVAGKSHGQLERFADSDTGGMGELEFAALVRKIDKTDTSWRQ